MTYTLGILLVWVFGLLAGAAAVVCALLLMTLRIAHGGGSSGQRKLFGAALILLSLTIFISLSYATAYVRARAELDAEIALVRESGEPLWFSELEPEPVDPALDATPLFRQAMSRVVEPSPDFRREYSDRTVAELADSAVLTETLEANRTALETLSSALQRQRLQWPYDYRTTSPYMIELPHVQQTRTFARLLTIDASRAIASGDVERAMSNFNDIVAISELLEDETFLVCVLTSISNGGQALDLLQFLLAESGLSDGQIADLDDRLLSLHDSISLRRSLVTERAALLTLMDSLGSAEAAEDGRSFDVLGYAGMGLDADLSNRLWGSWLYRPFLLRDQAFALSKFREAIDSVEPLDAESLDFANSFGDRLAADSRGYPVTNALFPAYRSIVEIALRFRQRLIAARLALRVDRYRSEHGQLPDSLEVVLDEALQEVPRDLFNDRPLVYEITEGGFSIHMDTSGGDEHAGELATNSSFDVSYGTNTAQ